MLKQILALILVSVAFTCKAQDYYPLHVGDTWYMGQYPQTIVSKAKFDSLEYYRFFDSEYYHYERISNGDLYYKNNDTSKEYLYLRINADTGTEWQVNTYFKSICRLESKTDTVRTNDTVFYNCYRYTFRYINVIDADYAIWLAPGVGIVRDSSLSWGGGVTITKALVDGKRIPSRILSPLVLKTTPYNLQKDVPVDVRLAAEFNFTLRKDLINSDNIKLSSRKRGDIKYHLDRRYGGSNFDIPFIPDVPLDYDDTVTVFLSKNLEDYMGDHLPGDYSFTFYTETENKDRSFLVPDNLSKISSGAAYGDFDFGDYDNDGDPDMVLFAGVDSVNAGFQTKLEVYNNDNGVFKRTDHTFNPIRPDFIINSCVKWLDFDKDGWPDLVFSGMDEKYMSKTQFYRNDKLSFKKMDGMELAVGGAYLAVNDYNRDGYPDIAMWGEVNSQPQHDMFIYKNSSGAFERKYSLFISNNYVPGINEWIDLNRDGKPGLIKTGEYLRDTRFFTYDDGQFIPSDITFEGNAYFSYHYNLDTCDVDKDGDLDFIIDAALFIRNGNKFVQDTTYVKGFIGGFSKFYDFDHDGYSDLFILGTRYDNLGRQRLYISVYKNNNGKMELFKDARWDKPLYIFSARWIDLDKDGRPDLVMHTDDGFKIYYNRLETTDVQPGEQVLTDFYLSQNYPNPFNPVTVINYGIPNKSFVEIKIYDMLGREVSTLVSKEHNAGSYKVQFNASSLPSGIYIYTIQAGTYSDSKKLIVLK